MNGDDDTFAMTGLGEDVVTAVYAGEEPAALLKQPHEILA
jgi:hypothetical protein